MLLKKRTLIEKLGIFKLEKAITAIRAALRCKNCKFIRTCMLVRTNINLLQTKQLRCCIFISIATHEQTGDKKAHLYWLQGG